MTDEIRRSVLINVAWLAGLVLIVGVMIGGSVMGLDNQKARVSALNEEIQRKTEGLRRGSVLAGRLEQAETALLGWHAMIDNEAQRIAQLSTMARKAGMTIVSLKGSPAGVVQDSPVASCAHQVQGIGTYRQIARFLEGIYSMDGMAAIDELDFHRADTEDLDLLEASMLVRWYCPAPSDELEEGQAQ